MGVGVWVGVGGVVVVMLVVVVVSIVRHESQTSSQESLQDMIMISEETPFFCTEIGANKPLRSMREASISPHLCWYFDLLKQPQIGVALAPQAVKHRPSPPWFAK